MPSTIGSRNRLSIAAGAAGPVAFVAAWVGCGLATRGYSPVNDAISRLAAADAPTRVPMTAGFVTFGVAVPAFAATLRRTVPGPAWIAAVATGVATLGVAATPLDGGLEPLHAPFAVAGYATLAAVPLLAARPLAAAGRSGWARASLALGLVAAASLVATAAGPAHGAFQRAGLSAGDAWLVAAAIAAWRGRLGEDS